MKETIDLLAKKINYLEYRQIEGLLHTIIDKPGMSSSELIQTTGLPKQTLATFKGDITFLLEPTQQDSIKIRAEHIIVLNREALREYKWLANRPADKVLTDKLKAIREKQHLLPKRNYDQFFATEDTSVAKALIIDEKGLLEDGEIALLGDDDMVSTALLLSNRAKSRITVFDIDQELLAELKRTNQTMENNNVQYVAYDVRNNPEGKYLKRYKVVVTDPPYTKTGITLFLNRAIELLDPRKEGHIFLYYGTSAKTPEKSFKMQEIINRMGLIIEEKLANFATYNGAESLGSTSDLYILKTTPFTKTVKLAGDFSGLYTNANLKEEKFPFVDHVVAKVYGTPEKLLKSKNALHKILGEFCVKHRLKVVDEKITKFGKGGGFTITFVLSNSNLIVHTWPELEAAHVDLITCSPIFRKEEIGDSLVRLFETKRVEVFDIE